MQSFVNIDWLSTFIRFRSVVNIAQILIRSVVHFINNSEIKISENLSIFTTDVY